MFQALKNENGLKADRLGFSLFQIDDGYQRAWGDWLLLDQERFPSQCMNVIVNQVDGMSSSRTYYRLNDLALTLFSSNNDLISTSSNLILISAPRLLTSS